MKCPSCQSDNPDEHKFCCACGHKLEMLCPQCQATNPPHYKFCGQCGYNLSSLSSTGTMTLARSGLITQVSQKALDMLGQLQNDMQGKPFSLFVERSDLVIFFSHLNELFSTTHKQTFEISLKHKKQNNIYVQIECRVAQSPSKANDAIELLLNEVTNERQAAVQLQNQQDLLGLIFSITNNVSTAGKKHLAPSMEDALKKITLFTQAQRSFIYGINRPLKRLEPLYQWQQPAAAPEESGAKFKNVPLYKVKHIIVRLHQEKKIVIQDLTTLVPPEDEELRTWLSDELGAAICYMIYSEKVPIGVIGTAQKSTDSQWTPESVALVQFFGNFIACHLPLAAHGFGTADASQSDRTGLQESDSPSTTDTLRTTIAAGVELPDADDHANTAPDVSQDPSAMDSWTMLPDMTQPMLFNKFPGNSSMERLPVFARDDGLVMITCPHCGSQESLPISQFDKLGTAIGVTCPCRNQFAAVLEKRRAVRKQVKLEGYFSVSGDLGPMTTEGSIWGPMMVIDLSKFGLRFSSEKAHLIHPGDILMVRFNLDNTNQALIHKSVKVISVSGFEVGCQFEGADSHDITLGFYFM